MPDNKTPRPPHPIQDAWDRFCTEATAAAKMLAEQVPAQPPLEHLTSAQYACGKLFAALDELVRAAAAPREVRDLVALPARAWQHAAWGIPDPLLRVAAIGGRKAADVPMTAFRAWVVKLTDELAGNSAASWRAAAEAVSSALRRAHAPKGCTPSAKSIQNLHGKATKPETPGDRHLAQAYAHYRPRPWPEVAGASLDERVQWIVAGYRMFTP